MGFNISDFIMGKGTLPFDQFSNLMGSNDVPLQIKGMLGAQKIGGMPLNQLYTIQQALGLNQPQAAPAAMQPQQQPGQMTTPYQPSYGPLNNYAQQLLSGNTGGLPTRFNRFRNPTGGLLG